MRDIDFDKCKKCGRYLIKNDECHCNELFIPNAEYLKEHEELMEEINEIQKETRFPQ